jgi:predicted metal-binding membrane protein
MAIARAVRVSVAVFTRDRLAVLAGLAGAVALAWLYLVPASLDMYGAMDGLSAWMMTAAWDAEYFVLMFGMWAVMMIGMMVPSALPAILLFGKVVAGKEAPLARTYAFAGGYVLAWASFSIVATVLQWGLSQAALLSPMMVGTSATLGAAVLIAAGIYQWTPLKQVCLTRCRSPMAFLSQHWRPGVGGALRLGALHGLYCVGCCWALMLLLFVGGVMSLLWIGAITIFVLLEKLAPFGVQGGKLSGALLVAAGVWALV